MKGIRKNKQWACAFNKGFLPQWKRYIKESGSGFSANITELRMERAKVARITL